MLCLGGENKLYKVKEVADIAGASVRTLHYDDGSGLLLLRPAIGFILTATCIAIA
jgi:hypothetical protein